MDTTQSSSSSTTPAQPAARPHAAYTLWRALSTAISVAVLVATLFTIWTPGTQFSTDLVDRINLLQPFIKTTPVVVPTLTPSPVPRIGIVAGHSGPQNDPGAVCADGLMEEKVNMTIATLVQKDLI